MKIAIIGAGNIGRALADAGARAGHEVRISAQHAEHARQVAAETGATAADSNREAVTGAEVVILAVPYPALGSVVDELGEALAGKVVVDPTNRINPADPASTLDGRSAAEEIAARRPGTAVVKAFNTAFAARQANPVADGIPLDGYVAGDDAGAKATVLDLVRSLGFRPVDVGPLAMARALEGMALLNITLNMQHGWPWQSGWKLLGPTQQAA